MQHIGFLWYDCLMISPQNEKTDTLRISISGGVFCESLRGETVLAALTRAGIVISAPCGGRGICGKCRVIMREGTVKLTEKAETEPKPGDSFSACRGIALTDITIELPEEEYTSDLSADMEETQRVKPQFGEGRDSARKKVRRAGLGVDIGTTTVQAELIDLDTGESLEAVSALNNQRSFGADVMSRINAARNGQSGELFTAINRQTEDILRHCIRKWNLSGIEQCAISGNTTMLHLFAGVDPSGMGVVPFTPVFLEERNFTGQELSLSVERITLLPGISAFVGADIVSGLAFLDILNQKEDSLLVDIGTNGEMALWKNKEQRLLCCSTAAGPCFEGAEISCGMGALPGAINRIVIAANGPDAVNESSFPFGPLSYTTLGNIPPRGICGAALVDAMAAMKTLSVIDETGALADGYTETGFPLAEGMAISQKDVRQFQLAKSAIRSGITVLCKRAGLIPENLGTVYIAGGFGFFINLESAVTAGLLPPEFTGKPDKKPQTAVCGNTSLKGAVQSLRDRSFLPRCREIIAHSVSAELSSEPDFADAFAENMYF